jgi:hypothetical protein
MGRNYMAGNIVESYMEFNKDLSQVSPCQWMEDEAKSFGYILSNTLNTSSLNPLIISSTELANDFWLDKNILQVSKKAPIDIMVYSPMVTVAPEEIPRLSSYDMQTNFIAYHCKLDLYDTVFHCRSSVRVACVTDDLSLRLWLELQSSFHDEIKILPDEYFIYFKNLLVSIESLELVLVYDERVAVNASLLFISNGVCYSGWNVTPPKLRCLGYGIASLSYRISRAKGALGMLYFFNSIDDLESI